MLSPPPDYQRLRELGEQGVLALIVETTRMTEKQEVKTHSEKVARLVLEDVMKQALEENRECSSPPSHPI